MQGLKKCDKSRGLRGTEILAISGHVAATLDHLTNELILCKPPGHCVQSRAALAALFAERMAVVTLLHLEDQSTLPLKRSPVVQKHGRNRNAAPRVHDRAPRRMFSEARKRSQRNRYE